MYQIIIIIFTPTPNPGVLSAAVAAILSFGTMHIFEMHGVGNFFLWWLIYVVFSSIFIYLSLALAIIFLIAFFTSVIPANEKKENDLIDKWYLESAELTPPSKGFSSALMTDRQGEQFTWEHGRYENHKIIVRPTSVSPEMLPGGPKYYKNYVSALKGDLALVEISSSYSVNTPPKENEKIYPTVRVYEIQHCMEPNPYCKKSGIDTWVVVSGKVLRPELADKNYENWIQTLKNNQLIKSQKNNENLAQLNKTDSRNDSKVVDINDHLRIGYVQKINYGAKTAEVLMTGTKVSAGQSIYTTLGENNFDFRVDYVIGNIAYISPLTITFPNISQGTLFYIKVVNPLLPSKNPEYELKEKTLSYRFPSMSDRMKSNFLDKYFSKKSASGTYKAFAYYYSESTKRQASGWSHNSQTSDEASNLALAKCQEFLLQGGINDGCTVIDVTRDD